MLFMVDMVYGLLWFIYGRKDCFDRCIKYCSVQPGIAYNFNTQNLGSFADNISIRTIFPLLPILILKQQLQLHLVSAPKIENFFAISYLLIFAHHPHLNNEWVVIERSFGHSMEKLTSLACDANKLLLLTSPLFRNWKILQ